ncbi:MAG: hypothetical protein ACYSTZ_09605 [Planctomycetota bacterium]|jgi:hypothetical protein
MAKRKKTNKKISKSMEGNKNAEKYDEAFVLDVLQKMIAFAKTSETVEILCQDEMSESEKNGSGRKTVKKTVAKKPHLKTELLIEFEIWSKNWFEYIAEKFTKNETVLGFLEAINMICETNSYSAAANNTSNPTIVKMNLVNHYNWSDKTSVDLDHTSKGEKISISPINWVDGKS